MLLFKYTRMDPKRVAEGKRSIIKTIAHLSVMIWMLGYVTKTVFEQKNVLNNATRDRTAPLLPNKSALFKWFLTTPYVSVNPAALESSICCILKEEPPLILDKCDIAISWFSGMNMIHRLLFVQRPKYKRRSFSGMQWIPSLTVVVLLFFFSQSRNLSRVLDFFKNPRRL